MSDQIFSTVQIEVNRWRWLPVNCVDSAGNGVGTDVQFAAGTQVTDAQITVRYIKYGQLSYSNYVPDNHTTMLATAAAGGATTIKLSDSSNFPPENGRIQIDPGGGMGGAEFVEYSYNNVSTGELTLTSGLNFTHPSTTTVLRIDWYKPPGGPDGSYLLLFPPSALNTVDLFTYMVTNGAPPGGVLFEPFQNTVDIIDTGATGTLSTPSISTCKLYGFLIDLNGQAVQNSSVSVRLLATPSAISTVAIVDKVISTKTDSNGYFEFTVAQAVTVDVVIPAVGYRRTVVVPNTTFAKLFELA